MEYEAQGYNARVKNFLARHSLVAFLILVTPFGWTREQHPTDLDGVVLPERAVCRLGSNRFLHADFITATAFSPDGRIFASASCGGQAMVWEWPSAKLLKKMAGGELRFSPDSQFLAIRRQGELAFLNIKTDQIIQVGKSTRLPVFSKKGKLAAWTVEPKKVCVQELSPNSEPRFLEGKHPIQAVAFDDEGHVVAAEVQDQIVSLTDLSQGKLLRKLDVPDGVAEWMELTPGARRLVFLSKKGKVHVFDLPSGKEAFLSSEIPKDFRPAVVRQDGNLLLLYRHSASQGLLWNLEQSKATAFLYGGCVTTGDFSPSGDLLATGGTNSAHAPLFWDTKTGRRVDLFAGHRAFVLCVAFSPDGKEAATCTFISSDPFIHFWDTGTGKPLRKLDAFPSGASRVAFSPDGKHVVAGGFWEKERDASVWEATSLKKVLNVKGHFYGAQLLALSSDGKKLATVGTTLDDVIVWDLATGKSLAKHSTLGQSSTRVVFLPGDRTIALGDIRSIHLWDWETNRERTIKISGSNMGFSPDGWLVAVADSSGTKLIEVLTGAEVWRDPTAKNASSHGSLAFAPNGRTIAVGRGDGMMHLCDWSKDGECLSFRGAELGPCHLVFSRDGTRLAGVEYATALIWDVADVVRRPFTRKDKENPKDIEQWCKLLSSPAGRPAYKAVWKLVAAGDTVLPMLKDLLRPAPLNSKQIAGWIADLDDGLFSTREKADKELKKLGEAGLVHLELALTNPKSLEQKRRLERIHEQLAGRPVSPEKLQEIRAIMVLEQIGTQSAREVLEWLATGDANGFLTQQVHLTLKRLEKK